MGKDWEKAYDDGLQMLSVWIRWLGCGRLVVCCLMVVGRMEVVGEKIRKVKN